ncbi:unnamed protein product [Meloidogyne enterolobii]|uniref:Uncharacterized protein n=1 Tax=Meloidogyne enterolobii TaxID=390850 RepID=A0ACB0Y7Y3_MELEN
MQAQPCLVPPVYEPGLTSSEYFRKCQEAGYNPDWPRRGQTMAEYLPNAIGRMWPPTWSRELPRKQAEGLLCLLWENLRYRGKRLPNVIPKLSQPAWVTLIQPGESVEDYFARKGQPLVHPRLPCLIVKGGIRGSSRRSRQRARATGKPCWKAGEPHEDYLPLELLTYESEEFPASRDNSPAASRQNTPGIPERVHTSTPDPELAQTQRGTAENENKSEDVLRIVIPRSMRPIKSITIVFTILAMCLSVCAVSNPVREISCLEFCRVILPHNYVTSIDNSYIPSIIGIMSKKNLTQHQQAYISTFGEPTTEEEKKEMNNLVASWEKIPKKKFKDNNNNKEKILEEDTSSKILPIATQIENEKLAAIQQQKEKATDTQQQPIVMTTLTQPTLQYQFAPAVTTLAQQQNTSTTVGQSSICGTSSSALVPQSLPPPNIQLVPAFPPPAIDVSAIPLANVRAEEPDGSGRRSLDNRSRRPYARGVPESGRRPYRQASSIRGLVDNHLRGLRTRAEQIATAASTALTEIEEENRDGRGEEYTQDLLAIEGATARLVKSIRTAFSRLPPR